MFNPYCTPVKLDSSGESDTSQSPEEKWINRRSVFNYLMYKMADNSDADSDNCDEAQDDSHLIEKIRQLEKEKEKLAKKNAERFRLEKQYKELSKSVKSLKGSSTTSLSSGYMSSSPSPGTLDKNRLAESSGLTSMLNEQRERLKNLSSRRSAETSSSRRDESGCEESESDEDKDSKNLDKVMSKDHKSKLQSNRDTLVESMIPDDIFNDLIANRVLTTADVSRIKEKNTREAMNEELLNNLVRRSDRAFYEFVRSLHKTLQGYLADLLEDPIPKPPSKKRQKRKRVPGELSINVDCEDVAPLPNKKKPLCSCQEVEEQILIMSKTAYLAIRRRDTTPAAFEQFKKELSQTNEILRESMEVMNTLKMLCEHGRSMHDISNGSIRFSLLCNSVDGAKDLWEKYSHGHLLDKFQQGLVNKSLLKSCHAKWVKLKVKIAEDEYHQCIRELENGNHGNSQQNDNNYRRTRLRSFCRKSSEENCLSFSSPYSCIPEDEPRRAFRELQRNLALSDHVTQPKKQRIVTDCETVTDFPQRNLLYNFRLRSNQNQL